VTSKPLLVLGTGNRKKGWELTELLAPAPLRLQTLADLPEAIRVEEDGHTFADNAAAKATRQARHLGLWVLGEDSGLMVDVLGGEPGVRSARYAGLNATDELNNRRLLDALGQTPLEKRSARFVCHMSVSDPCGTIRAQSEACCRGRILFEPQGAHGFGYDPLFEIVEYHRSFGQLGPIVKACLSHRARAAGRLLVELVELADPDRWT